MHTEGFDNFNQLGSYVAPAGSVPPVPSFTDTYTRNFDRQVVAVAKAGASPINYVYSSGRLNYLYAGAPPIAQGDTAIDWEYIPVGSAGAGHVQTITGPGPALTTTVPLQFAAGLIPRITYTYNGPLQTSEAWSFGSAAMASLSTLYDANLMPYQKNVTFGTTSSTLTYSFDSDGMVTCATPSGASCGTSGTTIYDYSVKHLGPNLRLSNDTVNLASETYKYDASYGTLKSQSMKLGGAGLMSINYSGGSAARDTQGRILIKQENWRDASNHLFNYVYDSSGRLSAVTDSLASVRAEAFTYDANGNRMSELNPSNGQPGTNATYDAQDRLITYTSYDDSGASHTWDFTYSDSGSLMSRTEAGIGIQLTYDTLGNLTQVTPNSTGSSAISYVVDGRGRRIIKKVGGANHRKWIYDGQLRIVAEQQLSIVGVAAVYRYVYGSRTNTPEVMLKYAPGATSPSAAYRIFSDHLGSPRYVVNAADPSDVLLAVHYSAFGVPTVEQGSLDAIPFGFAGGLYDPDTGLLHFGARDYDPMIGRWVSKDPILFGGKQTNLYVYVGNDPVNRRDISGLSGLFAGVEVGGQFGPGASGSFGYFAADTGQSGLFQDANVNGSALPTGGIKGFCGYYTGSAKGYLDANGFEFDVGLLGIGFLWGRDGWGWYSSLGWDSTMFNSPINFEVNLDQGNLDQGPLPQHFWPDK